MKSSEVIQSAHVERSTPINRKELIKRLGTSAPTLIRLEKKGIIPSIRLGGKILYDWNKVIEALEKRSK